MLNYLRHGGKEQIISPVNTLRPSKDVSFSFSPFQTVRLIVCLSALPTQTRSGFCLITQSITNRLFICMLLGSQWGHVVETWMDRRIEAWLHHQMTEVSPFFWGEETLKFYASQLAKWIIGWLPGWLPGWIIGWHRMVFSLPLPPPSWYFAVSWSI